MERKDNFALFPKIADVVFIRVTMTNNEDPDTVLNDIKSELAKYPNHNFLGFIPVGGKTVIFVLYP